MALPLSVAALGVGAAFAPAASASADPPPGRAFELVSAPSETIGGMAGLSTDMYPMPGRSSEDGDAVIFGSSASLGGNWSGPTNPMTFGWRTESGWKARTANRSTDHGNTPLELITGEARGGWLTPDGHEFVFGVGRPLGTETGGAVVPGIYRATSGPEVPEWLSQPQGDLPLAAGTNVQNISAGGEHNGTVVFQSTARLTDDAPSTGMKVYVNRDGVLELVSKLPDGSAATSNVQLANGVAATGASVPSRILRNQLADGGRYVLFVAGGGSTGRDLYVRDLDEGVTRPLAGSGSTVSEAFSLNDGWGSATRHSVDIQTVPGGRVFAASDAPRAFFKIAHPTGTVAFLHEADLETGEVIPRPVLTGPPLALSRHGDRMLFIDPPPTGETGDWTLRFWDASDPDETVAVATIPVPTTTNPYGFAHGYEPSPDGRTWVFGAKGSSDPERSNPSPGIQQLYVWNVGDAAPTCLSCDPTDGVVRTTGPNVAVQETVSSENMMTPTQPDAPPSNASKLALAHPARAVSDDGRWVLFDSPDRLIAEDRNDVRDVYLWDRDGGPGGEISLVTRGTGATPSYALDLDPTGRNAFFSTRDELVEADVNDAYDVYVARIGGGFPKSPESSCGSDACRPAGGAPLAPVVGSVAFDGRGNLSAAAGASVRVSTLKTVVGRVARLRVRVPGAGRVSVAGARVRSVGRLAGKAGTYTLRVALKPRARRALAKRKRLRVSVRVVYRSAAGERASRTVTVAFAQPERLGRKGGR